jgi:hypothetical protein
MMRSFTPWYLLSLPLGAAGACFTLTASASSAARPRKSHLKSPPVGTVRRFCRVLLLSALALLPFAAQAQTTWTGATSTDWNTASNWSAGVPTASNRAIIPDVTNDPIIGAGTAAVAQSVHVQSSASLTIQATASLTINGFFNYGGFTSGLRNEGTLANSGQLTLGSTASVGAYGIFNQATFQNNSGGQIAIDRASSSGLRNQSGTFTNAGQIIIGAVASVGGYGLWNDATFQNNSGGQIAIDRASSSGLRNQSGTFTNAAQIVIGAVASVGANGIENLATFQNNTCTALIHIVANAIINNTGTFSNAGSIIENASGNSSISSNTGVVQNLNGGTFTVGSGNAPITTAGSIWTGCTSTDWATPSNWHNGAVPTASSHVMIPDVTNDPIIGAGTAAVAKSVHVQSSASLTIQANASLTINGFFDYGGGNTVGLRNEGTLANSGQLTLGSTASVGFYGLVNQATFQNNSGGAIAIDRASYVGLLTELGTFTNAGQIIIGAVASVGDYGLWNQAAFQNNSGGAIAIDRASFIGLFNDLGTFTNAGQITIGAVASMGNHGLWNEATFQNNSGGAIAIDRASSIGLLNDLGTFTNAGQITIGAVASMGFNGLWNEGTFENNSGGAIAIDRTINSGLRNQSGTFTNAAQITIGAMASVGGFGLLNGATFHNNSGGAIAIDRTINSGLRNQSGTFTNAAQITIGAMASVGDFGLQNRATFENNSGGAIAIDRASSSGLYNNVGSFTNAGQITIGAVASVGDYGLWNLAIFQNNSGGHIVIDRASISGLYNFSATFTNTAQITIGTVASVGKHGLWNLVATFHNNSGGAIAIDRASISGLHNNFATFTNAAQIVIGAVASVGDFGIDNRASFQNNACAEIEQYAPLFNNNAFTNSGLMLVSTMGAHSNTALTNHGIIAYPQGNPIPNVTNNEIIVATTTANDCQSVSPAFGLGSPVDFTILGVFTDAGATTSAGTYSVATNTFTPTAPLSHGASYDYFVKIQDGSGGCTRIVPWEVTVSDGLAPSISCPAPVTVTCTSLIPAVNLGDVSASDNCGTPTKVFVGSATSDSTCVNRKTVTRTYRATDAAGNSSTCTHVITVFDNAQPTFTSVPAHVTVQCNSVPAVGTASATDGCGGTVNVVYNGQSTTSGACPDAYTLTRQWTATDVCGNTRTATQTITVIDTQKPNFTSVPANVTVQCNAIPAVGAPTATDNCDTSVAITYIGQTTTPGTCPNRYTLTRRWTAADNCGNTRTTSQVITVIDTGAPFFTSFPSNTTIHCNASIPPVGTPTASDGCGAATVQYLGQTTANSVCPGTYQLRRTWRATDLCGNTTASTQIIQVVDNTPPVFTSVPANVTINCNQPLPPLGNPTATDACSGYVHITFLGNTPSGSGCASDYTVTRTWRADDLCGNSTTATQVITVKAVPFAPGGEERAGDAPSSDDLRAVGLRVYPNPTTDGVWVDLTGYAGESVVLSIGNELGQRVWEQRLAAVEGVPFSVSLRQAGAAPGLYVVSVRSARGVLSRRVVLVE